MNKAENITWSPLDYLESAVIAQEALAEMLSRLEWMAIKPTVIVDMGCGLGEGGKQLQQHYPDATIISLDHTFAMLEQANASHRVCARGETLPLPDQSVNFIFANMLLPWHAEHKLLWQEWKRVLKPDGLLMVSALGVDTLRELHSIVDVSDMPNFQDMHDLGDGLLAEGFSDPVLDVNYYTTTYRSKDKLAAELYASGFLAKQLEVAEKEKLLTDSDGKFAVTYEIIYAHAFAPADTREIKIPISQIKRTSLS